MSNLKNKLLEDKQKQRTVIYGGSFNPPGLHHLQVVEEALKKFDKVIVVPCGHRIDKDSVSRTSFEDRKAMAAMTFKDIRRVEFDSRDLDSGRFTPTYMLEDIYKDIYPVDERWFLVGSDLVSREANGKSVIQNSWINGESIWQNLNWVIVPRDTTLMAQESIPPKTILLDMLSLKGSSSNIRRAVSENKDISDLVSKEVGDYIKEHNLYR